MNNQLWIFVAVAGLVAVTALWRGWLWVRKKARLSEQFQRDVRKEIDGLRQHVETLERTELGEVRQQVENLEARQSRDESQRSEQISGLRGRLERLSTKETETHMRERLDDIRQQVQGLEARQSRDESRRSEDVSSLRARLDELGMKEFETRVQADLGSVRQQVADLQENQARHDTNQSEEILSLRARLEALSTKESEAHMRETLSAVRQQVKNLAERQLGDESRRTAEVSDFRARLDRLSTKESEALMRESIQRVQQQIVDIQKDQAQREGERSTEIGLIRGKLDSLSTKESETRMRGELDAIRQQVGKIQERQTRDTGKASEPITEETVTRLGEMLDRACQCLKTILGALGGKADNLLPSEKPHAKKGKELPKPTILDESVNREEPDRKPPVTTKSRWKPVESLADIPNREEPTPKVKWETISHHRVFLKEGSEISMTKNSIAAALDLKEASEGHQSMLVREFPLGDMQMREVGTGKRKGFEVTVRSKEEDGEPSHETEKQIERVLDVLCLCHPEADAELRNTYSYHFLQGETGASVLLNRMSGQKRERSLIVLAQHMDKKWPKDYMLALCAEFVKEAIVIRLDHSASGHLKQILGPGMSCFDGAVRIYRPGWHRQDDPRKHHFFLWRDLGKKILEESIVLRDSFSIIRAKLPKESGAPVSDRKPDAPPIPAPKEPTVQEKVAQAMDDFKSGLLFGDDVLDGVLKLDSTAGPPDKVYRYLSVLNDLAETKKIGESLGRDEIQWLEEHGCHASGESKSGENAGLHKWRVRGVSLEFEKHAKPNDSTHPDRCVRIYYEWGEKLAEKHGIKGELGEQMKGKIVIGWVGRHP